MAALIMDEKMSCLGTQRNILWSG